MAQPTPVCVCTHSLDCVCGCHGRTCDPAENTCDLDFLPDEGGSTPWGCTACTPGQGAPHFATCPAGIGPLPRPDARPIDYLRPVQ